MAPGERATERLGTGEINIANPNWSVYRLPLDEQPLGNAAGRNQSALTQTDPRLVLQNLRWFGRLRWLVVVAMAALGALGPSITAAWPQGGIRIERGWPLTVAGVLAIFNLAYLGLAHGIAHSKQPAALALRLLWLQILLDMAVLTAVVHYMGSVASFAPFMYLFHIVLACIFFRAGQSLLITLAAGAMYVACVAAEYTGLIPPRTMLLPVPAWFGDRPMLEVLAWQCVSVGFISGTVWYLAARLTRDLRQREDELAATNRRLEAATDERAQHMLRTTHQLKAPFAAIHANTQLLLGGYCGPISDPATTIIRQISTRSEMLSREIKEMLQLANLRSAAQDRPPLVRIDLAALVRSSLAGLRPTAEQRKITLAEQIEPAWVLGIQDHVVMTIDNLVSNAIIYSYDGGRVDVICRGKPEGGVQVVIRDQGIGIPPEKLPRIFEDYFRTNEAVKHNRASTGLGLAIVRQAAIAGKIGVQVESAPGEGTAFILDFAPPNGAAEKTT
jgi:signal transduction histidine kinase